MKQQYTTYEVTRDPRSEFPELAGMEGIIIELDHQHTNRRGDIYIVTVRGCGAALEQQLNSASSVRSFKAIERNWTSAYPETDDDISDEPLRKNRKGEWKPIHHMESDIETPGRDSTSQNRRGRTLADVGSV